jgi:peptidoglycan/LPS O-acetylase OafA/YrhL
MSSPAKARFGRLEFLDVLRAVAALSVAFSHRAEGTIPGYGAFDAHAFRFGQFGVVLFFLCSGFIIPATIERYDSLERFWVNRFYRLFPLYWTAITAVLLLHVLGRYELPPAYTAHPVEATVANLTMLQAFLHEPLAIGLTWTLAFELAFYAMVSVLYVGRIHRRSVPVAALMLTLALLCTLHTAGAPRPVLSLLALAVVALGVRLLLSVAPGRRIVVAVLAGLMLPLLFNGYYGAWFGVLLFATMFTGAVLYRWFDGSESAARAAAVFAAALGLSVLDTALNAGRQSFVATFVAAYLAFGAALLLRRRSFPRPLVRLGIVSYSLYLLHPLVYGAMGNALDAAWPTRVAALVVALALSVALAEVGYRFVESPMIARGRSLAARAQRRADATEGPPRPRPRASAAAVPVSLQRPPRAPHPD